MWRAAAAGPRGDFAGSAVLALAVCAYACALALHGNGFIAAFVGGLAYGATSGKPGERLVPYVEETGALVSLLVWLAFGAIAVVPAFENLTWQTALYAVLSLTVIRMVPVALALAGGRLGRGAVAFVGWFGPRGLASVVFALLALEDLDHRCRAGDHSDRVHRAAQRGCARPDGQPARPPLRAAPRPSPTRRT